MLLMTINLDVVCSDIFFIRVDNLVILTLHSFFVDCLFTFILFSLGLITLLFILLIFIYYQFPLAVPGASPWIRVSCVGHFIKLKYLYVVLRPLYFPQRCDLLLPQCQLSPLGLTW